MKKILLLATFPVLLASFTPVSAAKWRLQVNTGADILASGFSASNLGMGLGLGIGIAVNENWSFWLNSNAYYNFASTSIVTDIFDEANLSVRYAFSGIGVNPYLRLGFGSFTDIASVIVSNITFSTTTRNFMLQGGVGLEFPVAGGLSLFGEADGGLVLATGTSGTTVPITAGLIFDL